MEKAIIDAVFKNYDIRGLVNGQITEELAYAVGNAAVRHYNAHECVVGRDGREDSPRLTQALIEGMLDAGCDVVDGGLLSTPQMKWIVAHHKLKLGIMVTASHNPPAYNGFKPIGEYGLAIGEEAGLHDLKPLVPHPVKTARGTLTHHNYLEEFVRFTMDKAGIHGSERTLFVDGSGGVFSLEMKKLAELGKFNMVFYNCDIDPHFRLHPPNPLDPSAMEYAKKYCREHKCIGAVFDADGDRSFFVDETGKEVPGDYFGAWVVEHAFHEGQGATSTVRDSRAVRDAVQKKHGTFMLGRVGHANIQRLMYDNKLDLGTEKSGHVFFKDSYYAENGLYGLLLVLKHLKPGQQLADTMHTYYTNYHSSPEINFAVSDRQAVLEAVKKHFAGRGTINTMDGVLVEGKDWWVNVRPSNTEPLVRLTFEAPNKEAYDRLLHEAEHLIAPFSTEKPAGHH